MGSAKVAGPSLTFGHHSMTSPDEVRQEDGMVRYGSEQGHSDRQWRMRGRGWPGGGGAYEVADVIVHVRANEQEWGGGARSRDRYS